MKHFTHRRTLPDGTILEVSGTDASTPDLPPFPKPDPEPPIGGSVVLPKKPGGDSGLPFAEIERALQGMPQIPTKTLPRTPDLTVFCDATFGVFVL